MTTTEAPEQQAVVPPGSLTTVSTTIAPWSWGQQNSAPPATGQVRSDQTTLDASAILWFSNTDYDGVDRSTNLAALKKDDQIRLQHNTNPAIWATYNVTSAAIANTGYYTVNVTLTGYGGMMPSNNALLSVKLSIVVTVQVAVGHMAIDLTLQPNITTDMGTDLMELFCEFLQTVTHLVNHAQLAGNIGGVIISDGEDILPAMVGDVFPPS